MQMANIPWGYRFVSHPCQIFSTLYHPIPTLTLSQKQILDASKLNEFAYDNFKFDENGTIFFKRVENTGGKGEIARHEQVLIFLYCFRKFCPADT